MCGKKRNTGSRDPDFDCFHWSFALETGPSKVGRVLISKSRDPDFRVAIEVDLELSRYFFNIYNYLISSDVVADLSTYKHQFLLYFSIS